MDLRSAGTLMGLAGLLLVFATRLKTNALVILASVLLSVGASLLAIHFLFGSYIVPQAYVTDRAETRALADQVARVDLGQLEQMEDKFRLVDRNREDIDLIVKQIGQQIDGFWIPLTFDIDKISQGEEFILPIDVRHDVEMMIMASNTEVEFLERYLALYINKQPLNSINAYINIRTPRKLNATVFNEGQYGQTFELRFRRDLSAQERQQYDADLSRFRQSVNHSDQLSGQISVLMVIRRPIFTTGVEEDIPEPGSN